MKTKTPSIIIGLDLGDKKHAICVVNRAGEIIEERSITNHRESLRRLSIKYPGSRIAFEVGTHSPWISRMLADLGHEVIVANPRKLRAIYANNRKSDQNDARMIARLARVDVALLCPIQHRDEEHQRDLLQIKLRDSLVRQRVDIISGIRSSLKAMGIRLPSPNTECFAKRCRTQLSIEDTAILAMIEPSLEVIDGLTKNIRVIERRLELLCEERYPVTQRLRQIQGVGAITALSFVLTIGDPERFESSRDVPAYLGLVPKRDQSGDLDKQLRISKAGDAYLRRLLVGSAQYILGHFGPDCDLKRKGLELAERGGKRAKKKAVVAVARKLAVLLHVLWTNPSDYQAVRAHPQAA